MEELVADLTRLDDGQVKPTTVVCAAGSGGTAAGLALGARLSGEAIRVVGVNVCDDRDYFVAIIDAICRQFNQAWLPGTSSDLPPYDIVDGYVGRGYALSRPEELAAIRDLARLEGVVLDPVYTGKAYFGMMAELAKNPTIFGERVVFIHTGGLVGLFPVAAQFTELV
jgi:D-cysteine desulfhydrase